MFAQTKWRSLSSSCLDCIISLLQDLFVPDGGSWPDWSAQTGRRFHPFCSHRWGFCRAQRERLVSFEEWVLCYFQGKPHLELPFSCVLFWINEIKDERRRLQDVTVSLLWDQVTLTPSEQSCSITSVTASSSAEAWRLESLTSWKPYRAAIWRCCM